MAAAWLPVADMRAVFEPADSMANRVTFGGREAHTERGDLGDWRIARSSLSRSAVRSHTHARAFGRLTRGLDQMYESFFGLREPAFSLAPDPRFLWLSDTHEEGLAALVYGITRRKGFMLLTGEVGAGKTTLLRAALDQIPSDTEVALVMNTAELTPIDLLRLIAAEFSLPGPFNAKVDYILALNRFLLDQLDRGVNTVLTIDEAQ
ncbi:MAG TPA: AAA family ATPase, partial [Myxococcota bacterium]|nr:AAA family ATPase [Myxococcota bacterium]